MGVFDLLRTNLTTYERVELWVTRSALLISFSIIGPTIILIILDFLLWCFRAGQGPSADLLRRSKSGMDLLQQKALRSRSNSRGSIDKGPAVATGLEMSRVAKERVSNTQTTTENITAVSQGAGRMTFVPAETAQEIKTRDEQAVADDDIDGAATSTIPREVDDSGLARPPAGEILRQLKLGKVVE